MTDPVILALIGVAVAAANVVQIVIIKKLGQIHILVNSRLTIALEEISALKAALEKGNPPPPTRPR